MSIHDQRAVKWIVAIVAWLYCQVYCCSAHADRPTVVVPGLGTIAGAPSPFAPDVDDFLGIPYAKPPVGDLRWQPPLPHGPFNASGPLDGTTFGPRCWQPTTRHNDSSPMSEDCLFLNVATPSTMVGGRAGRSLLPVMVWIHGGAYTTGQSNDYVAGPMVAGSNDSIVVVTLNYRLSVFGFLGGAAIAKRTVDATQGNFGIEDQRLALAWVKDHISAFGGDGDDITIFGESAGGNSVFNHLVTKSSFGFYTKAVIESGLYNAGAFTAAVAQQQFDNVIAAAKCSPGSDSGIACLLAASPAALLKVVANVDSGRAPLGWGPVVDGVQLTDTPLALVTAGTFNNKAPVLLGSNRDEQAYWTISTVNSKQTEAGFDVEMAQLGVVGEKLAALKTLYDPAKYPFPADRGNFSKWWWTTTRIDTDFVPGLGACSVRSVTRKLLAGGTPAAFVYLFAHPTSSAFYDFMPGQGPGAVTVPHASEIQYVFNMAPTLTPGPEADLASPVTRYWSNFAQTGEPNSPQTPQVMWPRYTAAGDQTLRLDVGPHTQVQTGLRKSACDHWDSYVPPAET